MEKAIREKIKQDRDTHGKPEENTRVVAQTLQMLRVNEIQPYGVIVKLPIGLEEKTCIDNVANLNQVLADTITLRDLYKKCHWQVSGPTFYSLHLLFDKHSGEQGALVDLLAERVQTLGGMSIAMAADVAELTIIPRPSRGRDKVLSQLSRLLHAHEIILKESRTMARLATGNGDDGTNDILVSHVVRTNELQVWIVSQHLVQESGVREGIRHGST